MRNNGSIFFIIFLCEFQRVSKVTQMSQLGSQKTPTRATRRDNGKDKDRLRSRRVSLWRCFLFMFRIDIFDVVLGIQKKKSPGNPGKMWHCSGIINISFLKISEISEGNMSKMYISLHSWVTRNTLRPIYQLFMFFFQSWNPSRNVHDKCHFFLIYHATAKRQPKTFQRVHFPFKCPDKKKCAAAITST